MIQSCLNGENHPVRTRITRAPNSPCHTECESLSAKGGVSRCEHAITPWRKADSRKSAIVAADVSRLTLKKTNGTEPPDVGCYGFLNQPWARQHATATTPTCTGSTGLRWGSRDRIHAVATPAALEQCGGSGAPRRFGCRAHVAHELSVSTAFGGRAKAPSTLRSAGALQKSRVSPVFRTPVNTPSPDLAED